LGGEEGPPLCRAGVGGEDDRAAAVARVHETEDVDRERRVEVGVAEFVDAEDLGLRVAPEGAPERGVRLRGVEILEEIDGGRVEDGETLEACGARDRLHDARLPGARRAEAKDVAAVADELAAEELLQDARRELGPEREVEAVEPLDLAKASSLEAALEAA